MSSNLTLAVLVAVLVGAGTSLLMSKSVVRAFLGVLLMGNGVNLLFLIASGRAGRAPIVGTAEVEDMSDPLPQAMVLTAIVITLALTGFVLALAHRSWQLLRTDMIVDDDEDARILARAEANDMSASDFAEDAEAADPEVDPDPGGHHRAPSPAHARTGQERL